MSRDAELVDFVPLLAQDLELNIKDAMYVPGATENILSVGRLEHFGWTVDKGLRNLIGSGGNCGVPIVRRGNVYYVELEAVVTNELVNAAHMSEKRKREILEHHRKH